MLERDVPVYSYSNGGIQGDNATDYQEELMSHIAEKNSQIG